MARIHYAGDVPYTVEIGPHRGWTTYYFEIPHACQFKLLTQEKTTDTERDRSTIYSMMTRHDSDEVSRDVSRIWPHYRNVSFDEIITISTAISYVSAVFAAFSAGTIYGRVDAQRDVRKALGL